MKWLDAILDQITIYRVLLYYLLGLHGAAVILSCIGILAFDPISIVYSSAFLVTICWLINKLLAFAFHVPTNPESSIITALILALIMTPASTVEGFGVLTIVGGIAMASKYILALRGKHIFNPAAIGVLLGGLVVGTSASWWIGTAAMLPFVVIGGILLARRLRRVTMIASFIGVALLSSMIFAVTSGSVPLLIAQTTLLQSAVIFVGCVMLTEPLTSPTTKTKQICYAMLVGVLFSPQIHIGTLYSSPELALAIGNVFGYAAGPRVRTVVHLRQRKRLTHDAEELIFTPKKPFSYRAGQYIELTFQHKHSDSRGVRRYFTIASSPTEPDIRLGVKFYEPGSTFKRALREIDPQTPLTISQLGGDFTLPANPDQKVVFIAGGIGITPYRSMLKYMIDTDQKRPTILLYAARTQEDVAYKDLLQAAQSKLQTTVIYAVHGERIDATFVKKHVQKYKEYVFYISGPHGMVTIVEDELKKLGVSAAHIKKDFFSGYA